MGADGASPATAGNEAGVSPASGGSGCAGPAPVARPEEAAAGAGAVSRGASAIGGGGSGRLSETGAEATAMLPAGSAGAAGGAIGCGSAAAITGGGGGAAVKPAQR